LKGLEDFNFDSRISENRIQSGRDPLIYLPIQPGMIGIYPLNLSGIMGILESEFSPDGRGLLGNSFSILNSYSKS